MLDTMEVESKASRQNGVTWPNGQTGEGNGPNAGI